MLRNLKHSILFTLIVLASLSIAFVTLASSNPISQIQENGISTPLNPIINGNWSGLQMGLFSEGNTAEYDGYLDTLQTNGFTQFREVVPIEYSQYWLPTSKAAVLRAEAKGAKYLWGVTQTSTITSSNWATYRQAILDAAMWAQANGVYEFQLGNELELFNDKTTLSDAQLIANVKSVATEVQAIFTRGNVSYTCLHDYIGNWAAAGKGDIDVLASNVYKTHNSSPIAWKNEIDALYNAFGANGTAITEFGPDCLGVNYYSNNETEQAAAVKEMLDYIQASGISRAFYFNFHDYDHVFSVVKPDGSYRLLWGALTGANTSTPNITVSPKFKAFGPVDIASIVNPTQAFTITNTGSASLSVGTITITGTDANQFAKSADNASGQTIAAGASKTLTITFDPSSVGAKTASLSIPSNDPDTPALTASLSGTGIIAAIPNITVSPTSKAFGSVDIASMANPTQAFTITNTGSANLSVGTITITGTDAAQFAKSADNASGQTIAAGASKTLTVTFDPSSVGAKTASLSIPSNDPDTPALTASLSGTGIIAAIPNITVSPTSKAFGSVDIASMANPTQAFTITNTGSANLSVGTITITGTDAAQFAKSADNASGQTIAAGASKTLTVTFDPSSVGAKTASLSIPSNDPDTPALTASLSGTGTITTTPDITMTPASNDFGPADIDLSTDPTQTFTITNTGSANLNVGTITITGTDATQFAKSDDNASGQTIAAGASKTVTVTFDPSSVGAKTASLSIPSNDPDTPALTAVLSGSGTTSAPAPSLTINEGEPTTTSKTVELSMEASGSDAGLKGMVLMGMESTGLVSMKFANSSKGPWSALEDYSATKSWTLSSGPGVKTVYAKIYDSSGDYTIKSDTINLIPDITLISPDPASGLSTSLLNTITITGTTFGSRTSSSYILFSNGTKVTSTDKKKIPTWSDTLIKLNVPSSAATGNVVIKNSSGASSAYAITIDSTGPNVTLFTINEGETTTTSKTVEMSIEASDIGEGLSGMQFANSSKGPFSALEDYNSSKSNWKLSDGPGTKTAYVKVYDSAGNYSIKSAAIVLIPNITLISPDTASGLSTSDFNTITITGSSFGSSRSSSSYVTFANGLKVSSKDKSKVPVWSDSLIKVKVPSSAVTGYVTVTNSAGISAPYGLTIDSVGPTVTLFTINEGELATTSSTVALSIDASDFGEGLAGIKFANSSSGPWSTLEAYSSSKASWTLTSGPGTKTVYVMVYDSAGNYTIKSDTINLIPDITLITPDPISEESLSASDVITITGSSFGSSRSSSSYITFANGIKISSKDNRVQSWSDTQVKVRIPSSAVTGDVTVTNSAGTSSPYAITVGQLADKTNAQITGAGSPYGLVVEQLPDTTKPVVADFKINNNDSATDAKDVALTISATDDITLQNLLKMRFKNESDTNFTEWEDYKSSKDWSLLDEDGLKTVTVEIKDEVGNTTAISDSITLETTVPDETTVTVDTTTPETTAPDKTAPQAGLAINNDEAATGSRDVTLNLSASDDISSLNALSIRYKDEVSDWSGWEGYPDSNQKAWTLSEGEADKTVYIQVKDEAGNTADAQDSISYEMPAEPVNTGDYAAAILESINNARTGSGLSNLSLDHTLSGIAEGRSQDMIARNYFSHTTPGGKDIFDILQEHDVTYSAAGENIAQISPALSASAELFFNMWMESDGHRANILSSDFTQVGIGISFNDEKIIAVLVFLN